MDSPNGGRNPSPSKDIRSYTITIKYIANTGLEYLTNALSRSVVIFCFLLWMVLSLGYLLTLEFFYTSNRLFPNRSFSWVNNVLSGGAAVAQWIRLRLPSCRPGSNPKHTIYTFIKLYLNCDM